MTLGYQSSGPSTAKFAKASLISPRLLVVDDDRVQRILISQAGRSAGHCVTEARSVAEAIDLIQSVAFDCVVLDLTLEDGDGFDVLRAMGMAGYGGCVIIVSGAEAPARHASRVLAQSLDMDLLQSFHKPVDLGALRLSLHNVRRNQAGLPTFRE
ncbi:MAG: response regulator [Alphaproteobacteria bacterium]|nr:response regulator [Alphaproteobacteria bacterium]